MLETTATPRRFARDRQPPRAFPVLGAVGVLGAVAAAWSGAVWEVAYLGSIGDPDRGYLLEAAGVAATTAAILLVSLLALRVLGAPAWLCLPPLAAACHLVHVTVRTRAEAFEVPRRRFSSGTMESGVFDAFMPHVWPLLVVVIAAVAVLVHGVVPGPRRRADRFGAARSGGARRAVLGATVVLAAANGAVTWWGLLYFIWYRGDPADYQAALTAVLTTTAVLVGGGVAARSLGGGRTTDVLVVMGVLGQLVLAAVSLDGATAPADPDASGDFELLFSVQTPLLVPGSYPLLLVIVVAVVRAVLRGRSHPTPRRPQDP